MQMTHDRFQLSEMAGNLLFENPAMAEMEWRFDDQKMGKIDVYCAPPPLTPHPTHTPSQSYTMVPMLATGIYRRCAKLRRALILWVQHASHRRLLLQDDA